MSDTQSYTLRFPFQIGPNQLISDFPDATETNIDGLTWRFELKDPYYVLKVIGFPVEAEAHTYAKRIWNGLTWSLLDYGIPFEATLTFDRVVFASDPQAAAENLHKNFGLLNRGPVDGLLNDNAPAIYPSEKRIRTVGVGNPTVTISTPFDTFLSLMVEGMSIRDDAHVDLDPKLQTALDLYSAYWYEHTSKARLLTLVMALETLMDDLPRHPVVIELLGKWEPDVTSAKARYAPKSEEYLALESLERELIFKKTDSLRRQVRTLVYKTLKSSIGEDSAQELARKAVDVYDKRSVLVHEGHLPEYELNRATADAKEIVEKVLKTKFRAA
jgi:hypothetical protein